MTPQEIIIKPISSTRNSLTFELPPHNINSSLAFNINSSCDMSGIDPMTFIQRLDMGEDFYPTVCVRVSKEDIELREAFKKYVKEHPTINTEFTPYVTKFLLNRQMT